MDIAGLIRGASEGAGLGNKFLSTIRNCEVIVHLVRCFDGGDIIHVENSVDPVRVWASYTRVVPPEIYVHNFRNFRCVTSGHPHHQQRTDPS